MHPFLAAELGSKFDLERALRLGLVPGVLGADDPAKALRAYVALYVREELDAGVFRSIRPSGPLDRPEEIAGAALEGLVAQHLLAWIEYGGVDARLWFWRTKSGNEVDFVIYGRDAFVAIEVQNRARVDATHPGALRAFGDDYPEAKRVLAYRGSKRLPIDGVLCVPCDELLSEIVGRARPSGPGSLLAIAVVALPGIRGDTACARRSSTRSCARSGYSGGGQGAKSQ